MFDVQISGGFHFGGSQNKGYSKTLGSISGSPQLMETTICVTLPILGSGIAASAVHLSACLKSSLHWLSLNASHAPQKLMLLPVSSDSNPRCPPNLQSQNPCRKNSSTDLYALVPDPKTKPQFL